MNQVAMGPGGKYKIQINGQWHDVEQIAANPDGMRKGQVDGKWYDIPADDTPKPSPVQQAAIDASPQPAAPAPAEDAGLFARFTNQLANNPPGTRGELMDMGSVTTPEMRALEAAKTDEMYNIRPARISMEESNKLGEASHTSGYARDPESGAWAEIGGDMGAGVARAFLYDEDYAAILSSRNPGSELFRDPEGNLIIKYQDGDMERINKSGFSATDALQLPGEIAAYTGVGALYRRAAKSAAKPIVQEVTKRTLLKNAGKESGKAAAFSTAKDAVGSYAATGEVDIDPGRVAMEAGTAGLIQPAIDIGVGGYSKMSQKFGQATKAQTEVDDAAGELAAGVRDGLEKAGYNMDQNFTTDQISKMNNYYMANPHLPPEELGRAVFAVSEGTIPTNALISQDTGLKLRESNTIKKGEEYKPTLDQGPDAPQSYREHILDPRGRRTEGVIEDIDRPKDLGNVQEELAAQRTAEYDESAMKFEESRAEGFSTGELAKTKEQNNKIRQANKTIQQLVRSVKGVAEMDLPLIPIGGKYADGTPWRVSMGDILAYRDTIRGLGMPPPKERAAIQALQDAIDTNLDDAIWERGPGLFSIGQGGGNFLDKWREGIDALGTTFKKWNSEKFVTRALETLPDGTFKHDGRQIADNLFGGINGKFLGKSEARRAVSDLQSQLPDDLWKQVQSELKYRLMGLDKFDPVTQTLVGGKNIARDFNKFVDEYPELALDIFGSAEELATRQNYIKQIGLEYADPKLGAANMSNTSLGVGDKFDRGVAGLKERGGAARALGVMGDWFRNPTGQAQRQTRDMLLDNAQRARGYTGRAPQVGGLLSLLDDEEKDFQIPFRR